MSFDRALGMIAAATLVSGCHIFNRLTPDCHRPQEYQRATQLAPLKVPPGGARAAAAGPARRLSGCAAPLQAGSAQQGGQQQLGSLGPGFDRPSRLRYPCGPA